MLCFVYSGNENICILVSTRDAAVAVAIMVSSLAHFQYTPAIRRRAPAGVRKNTRIRQALSQYGQQQEPNQSTPWTEHTTPQSKE